MNGSQNDFGKAWRLKNSLWVLLGFFGLGGFAVLYIGNRVNRKKWKIVGAVLIAMGIIGVTGIGSANSVFYDISSGFMLFSVLGSIALPFIYRGEYLVRLEAMYRNGNDPRSVLARQLDLQYQNGQSNTRQENAVRFCPDCGAVLTGAFCSGCGRKVSLSAENGKTEPKTDTRTAVETGPAPASVLDINNCTAEELTALPGINAIQAKKAEAYRAEKGGFSDLDEFFSVLQIKPHFAVSLRENLTCSAKADSGKKTDRKLDF